MRFLSLLFVALTVHGAFCSPTVAREYTTQNKRMDVISVEKRLEITGGTTDLAIRSEDNALEKRLNLFWLVLVGLALPSTPVTFLFGLYSLTRSVYDAVKDCKEGLSQDCIFHGVDLVVGAAFAAYKIRSGIKREIDGRVVYASVPFGRNSNGEIHAHVEPIDGSLKAASLASENNGTWELHATATWNGVATHHIFYRTATKDDLGFENDGSYHHYRAQRTPEYAKLLQLSRREESSYGGVVTDYLWKNENQNVWQDFHDAGNYNTTGSNVANWMENNQSEATCAVQGIQIASHGGSTTVEGDNGVIAYGWNDQPFGFNGRAGGWVDSCQ